MTLSAAEAGLQAELRGWLETHHGFATVLARSADPAARDETLWHGLVDGGWIARALPRRDNLQQSTIDGALVAEEFGRALVIEPFFRSGFLAANLLFEALDPAAADPLIEAIGAGLARYACALYEPDGGLSLRRAGTAAERDGEGWRLSGRKAMVFDGAGADQLLVTATTPDGHLALFELAGDATGVMRTPFHTIDGFAAADILLDGAAARALAGAPAVADAIEAAVDRTITALGGEVLGAASAALDETAAYTGKRVQFGRPISGFQVVAHRLARMFVELDGLRGGLIEALSHACSPPAERAEAAAGLKVLIGENGRFVVNQGVQLHGGNGTIHEYKVSHCFRRVFAADILYGNGDHHLSRYATAMA